MMINREHLIIKIKKTRIMFKRNIVLYILILNFLSFTACSQDKITEVKKEAPQKKDRGQHPYGGWYCPDNFGGFPPIDIQDLDDIQVVSDRLPTKEETRNGISLMYIDETEYPNARALDMDLPRLARSYSSHSDINELVIVIQAVAIGQDTVVGFRYPNGGNGSAWMDEVSFLSDDERKEMGSLPYVYLDTKIKGNKEDVWNAITKTLYAEKLGDKFNKKTFFRTEWNKDSRANLNYNTGYNKAAGIAMNMWGNIYMHIDYDNNGFHFAEKVLISEDKENNTAELHVVAGPYPEDYGIQNAVWEKWIEEVEQKMKK